MPGELDKLGVTGSSPVPPIHESPADAGFFIWTNNHARISAERDRNGRRAFASVERAYAGDVTVAAGTSPPGGTVGIPQPSSPASAGTVRLP
jgi:hypothetical protein